MYKHLHSPSELRVVASLSLLCKGDAVAVCELKTILYALSGLCKDRNRRILYALRGLGKESFRLQFDSL